MMFRSELQIPLSKGVFRAELQIPLSRVETRLCRLSKTKPRDIAIDTHYGASPGIKNNMDIELQIQ